MHIIYLLYIIYIIYIIYYIILFIYKYVCDIIRDPWLEVCGLLMCIVTKMIFYVHSKVFYKNEMEVIGFLPVACPLKLDGRTQTGTEKACVPGSADRWTPGVPKKSPDNPLTPGQKLGNNWAFICTMHFGNLGTAHLVLVEWLGNRADKSPLITNWKTMITLLEP